MPLTGRTHLRGILGAGFLILFALATHMNVPAQVSTPYVRMVRTMEADDTGVANPAGLAYSAGSNVFHVVEAQGRSGNTVDITQLNQFALRSSVGRVAAAIDDPINIAFDDTGPRLLIYRSRDKRLLEVQEGPNGRLDPATLATHNAAHFPLQDPQGLTLDPATGVLYFLEARGQWIVRIEPAADGRFDGAVTTAISLQALGATDVRGLAFDPTTEHLHVMSLTDHKLYELTGSGEVVAVRDLAEFELGAPRAMVFAPSGDQTDDLDQMSLYLVDGGTAVNPGQDRGVRRGPQGGPGQWSAQIVEFSLTPPRVEGPSNASGRIAAAASSFTSTVVRVTDMSAFTPPSPDPSGLAYVPGTNTLMMSDGEVEEKVSGITHFRGANVWHLTLSGSVISTANISKVAPTSTPMSDEPTGVAWNPNNGHWFFSDDVAKKIFDLDPGNDGKIGTADDTWTSFGTTSVGSGDPEGVAYDPATNRLFVADGVNQEIYVFTPTGQLLSQFDVARYGIIDPETAEFNRDSGTLFVLSKRSLIVETTTAGALIQTIDASASKAKAPAGLAYGPASNGSSAKRFYIVARGVDNNSDPRIIDGKMYEMTAPSSGTPTNQAPIVNAGPDQTITLPSTATVTGSYVDDDLPSNSVTVLWTQVSGPGTATFANAKQLSTTVSFPTAGTYVLRLTADDGELTGSDQLTIVVNPEGAGGGTDLIFADGFESGDLSAWSSSDTDGGNLSASTAAALVGGTGYGLQALINDTKALYVTDESPANEPRYRARFYFDPNSMQMASGDTHYLFQGFISSGTVVLRVYLRFSGGQYLLRAGLRDDGSSWSNTAWNAISDAPHVIELDWRAATAAGANNGGLTLWIDNVQKQNLTTVDNDTRRIDRIRLGPVAGIDPGTQGTYFFDAFESRRQNYIGGATP